MPTARLSHRVVSLKDLVGIECETSIRPVALLYLATVADGGKWLERWAPESGV